MTRIVGIDFGTSNVRIAHWDAGNEDSPSTSEIGRSALSREVMPATIAFERMPGGKVEHRIGEEADRMDDSDPNIEVVRNIKRWALTSDEYFQSHLEWNIEQDHDTESWPTWWDPDTRSIRLWNDTMPVQDAIRIILHEAISRSGLGGVAAEWRAGCPVSSDLVYRKALVSALEDLGCTGSVRWISEEPLLALALGNAIGSINDGESFLVYDMGGGSFDCAIANNDGGNLIVYAEEDLPTLGGMDIDNLLARAKGYGNNPSSYELCLLREAKEQLYSGGTATEYALPGGKTLKHKEVKDVLEDGNFMRRTLMAMLDAYKKAKLIWKRPSGDPPYGEYLPNGESVWSLNLDDMKADIDRVLVVGGPTRIPYFAEELRAIFGHDKVATVDDLVLQQDIESIPEAALTALSHGACYMYGSEDENSYIPLNVDRIPARITLSVTDGQATIEDTYDPFQRLPIRPPIAPYQGRMIRQRAVNEGGATILDPIPNSTYSVLIEDVNGNILYNFGPEDMRMPRDGFTGPRTDRIQLIVDRLGSVWVELDAGFTHISKPFSGLSLIVRHPVWQTDAQKKIIDNMREQQRRYRERQAEITKRNVMGHPWEYPF